MAIATVADFVSVVGRSRLLPDGQWQELERDLRNHFAEAPGLARELVQRGWLTVFQVNELFCGRGDGLLLGSYVLLEKLGEGGMGTVYKARNWKLDRIVALKLIKKERLANPNVVKRFYREIRSVAHLNHLHIVRAFDADEVAGTHFFVMEFVEGIDLARLVKLQGPLPVAQACEYVRQAALGLQHAFERGLVHRDIKPHNLLVTGVRSQGSAASGASLAPDSCPLTPVVKILDMGLALAETAMDESMSSTMTQEGMMMGTPDYVAPEQIMDSHRVDIRADLYSLGCTLYYLLAGRPPFKGSSLGEKLVKHQTHEPEPIERHRPDVPEAVAQIVHKLLAKRPEERMQTPAELAQSLAGALADVAPPALAVGPLGQGESRTEIQEGAAWVPELPSLDGTMPAVKEFRQRQAQASRNQRRMWLLIGAGFWGVVFLALGGYWLVSREKPKGEPVDFGGNKPRPVVKEKEKEKEREKKVAALTTAGPVTDEWIKAVQALPAEGQVKAVFAKLKELNEGFDDQHGHNNHKVKDGKVVMLSMLFQHVTDIAPVRALKDLEDLTVGLNETSPEIVSLADLGPLKGLPLKRLALHGNRVDDLSPLAEMRLESLNLSGTRVKDLSPLKKMSSLTALSLDCTPVTDLASLEHLKLASLWLRNTGVKDLRPLAAMPLSTLDLWGTDVADLAGLPLGPWRLGLTLAGSRVEDLAPLAKSKSGLSVSLHGVPYRSLEPLHDVAELHMSMAYEAKLAPTLKRFTGLTVINGMKAAHFWKLVDADPEQDKWLARVAGLPVEEQIAQVRKRMNELNPGIKAKADFKQKDGAVVEARFSGSDPNLVDLRFLQPFKHLQVFDVDYAPGLRSLEPLRGMPVQSLSLSVHALDDLSPLAGMPLRDLVLSSLGGVGDPSSLKAVKTLRRLDMAYLPWRLAPLLDLPLTQLSLIRSSARDFHLLKSMKSLEELRIAYDDFRHRDTLKAMTWLKKINGKAPEEFWKEIAEQQAEFVRRELKRLNPGFDKATAKIEKGAVIGLEVNFATSSKATDLSAVSTLTDLARISVILAHTASGERSLSLEPLRGLPLAVVGVTGFVPENLVALQGKTLEELGFGYSSFKDLSILKGVTARTFSINVCPELTDLSPLRGMSFDSLECNITGIKDLSPLRDVKVKELMVNQCPVEDLAPLRDLPLTRLILGTGLVKDLTPLSGMKALRTLAVDEPRVKDLQPLEGLALESLHLYKTVPADLGPLKKSPLKHITLKFEPFRGDADVLRAIPTLETINGQKAKQFLADAGMASLQKWCDSVASLPAKGRLDAITARLKKENPEWTGSIGEIDDRKLRLEVTGLTELSALRGAPDLTTLRLECRQPGPGTRLTNLWPLADMTLQELVVEHIPVTDLTPVGRIQSLQKLTLHAPVADLSPLQGLKSLRSLALYFSAVSDLAPLRGLPLEQLVLTSSKDVRVLDPLAGMPLKALHLDGTNVRDLTPLQGMVLKLLVAHGAQVKDYSVLRGMPLTSVTLDFVPWRDSGLLRSIRTLKDINIKEDLKPFHAWADWEDAVRAAPAQKQTEMVKAKLFEVNGKGAGEVELLSSVDKQRDVVTYLFARNAKDLSPLRALRDVETLEVPDVKEPTSLEPLRGLKLKKLTVSGPGISDLTGLEGMPLESLMLTEASVADLTPLRDLPLRELICRNLNIGSLEALRDMKLERLELMMNPKLTSLKGLEKVPLKYLRVWGGISSLEPVRACPLVSLGLGRGHTIADLSPLKGMMTLRIFHDLSQSCVDVGPLQGLALEEVVLHSRVRDLYPLQGMPIRKLACTYHPWRDYEVVTSLAKLEEVDPGFKEGSKAIAAAEFRKRVDRERAEFEARAADLRKLPAEKQADEVMKWLAEVNKGFDGKLIEAKVANNKVVGLKLVATQLTNIAPVAAMTDLEELACEGIYGRPDGACKLADLWPLRRLGRLKSLHIAWGAVADLTPLQGIKLTALSLPDNTSVADLKPLRGMELRWLNVGETSVSDLAPLKGMPLRHLLINATKVSDLNPVLEAPLKEIWCTLVPARDAPILRQIKTLEKINGKKAVEVLK